MFYHGSQHSTQLPRDEIRATATVISVHAWYVNSWPVYILFTLNNFFHIFAITSFFFFFKWRMLRAPMLDSCVSLWLPPFFLLWVCNRPVSRTAASHLNCSDHRLTHLLLQQAQVNKAQIDTETNTNCAGVRAHLSSAACGIKVLGGYFREILDSCAPTLIVVKSMLHIWNYPHKLQV